MRLKFTSQVIPHGVIIAVVGTGLWMAREWPYETALFPRAAGLTVILIALVSLLSEMWQKGAQEAGGGAGREAAAAVDGDFLKKAAVGFAWLAGFIFGVWALGYAAAAMIFLFLFMKVKGGQAWLTSILVTAGAFAFMQLIFGMLLNIKWFAGALWGWLGL
jgi:hypothetical protein